MTSRWSIYDGQIKEHLESGMGFVAIAQAILNRQDSRRSNKEVESFSDYVRKHKTRLQNPGILEACSNVGTAAENAPMLWLKTKTESVRVTNPLYEPPIYKDFENLQNELIKSLQDYSPKFQKLERQTPADGHLLVIDPADIHIGKLCSAFEVGEAYDNQIAVKRVLEGVQGILNKTSAFNIDKIMFVGGNDILHIDSPRRTTTSGTPQDTDGDWHTNFLIAKDLYVAVLEKLLTLADVHFVFNPSNHDYTNGFFLAQVIQTYFRNCSNITFDCSISHRKYYRYHNNLIGSTHGDGAKVTDLPMLMAHESKDWTDCRHRYIYTHHVHHKSSKDYMGVCVESLRSPSGTDSWHHRNGYEHSPKAVEAFLHDKIHGQISRITHLF